MRRYLLLITALFCLAGCVQPPTKAPYVPTEIGVNQIGVGTARGYASVRDLVFVKTHLYVRYGAKTIVGKDVVTEENALFIQWQGGNISTRWYHKPTPRIPAGKVVPSNYREVKIIL